jgi:DNA-binding MarR family transcriptional regulator
MYSTMKSTSNIRDFKYFQNSLGFKINKLSKELKRYSSKIIKAYPSLGIPELFTLNVIGENKKEVSIKYISSVHWADQAEISRGVQKLIKLSLINKAKNHDDLRYTLLRVTSDGKKLHRELLKKQTDRNKKLLKDFSNEEIVHMQKLLDKLLISSQKYLIFN